ncbi:hypothetical protein RHMOL_Rhmol02G0226200 [Rhododendron molle]|uniref:Uncharacterized protein n=1 Tax=Rhododendron molle TaxID=49168 RepID=A0ACC0PUU8_RHOML|nr:hypothetical protein RHMOL_Rhmol02G0226200 [Rhododendron molle]
MMVVCRRRLRQQLHFRQKATTTPSQSLSLVPSIASPPTLSTVAASSLVHRDQQISPSLAWVYCSFGRIL